MKWEEIQDNNLFFIIQGKYEYYKYNGICKFISSSSGNSDDQAFLFIEPKLRGNVSHLFQKDLSGSEVVISKVTKLHNILYGIK